MSNQPEESAWLEKPEGDRIPITGSISFGRFASSEVVLADDRVSRRHAMIQVQGEGEFWVIDLGSRNGTYVNQRRVQQPLKLRDNDSIRVGPFTFLFRQPGSAASEPTHAGMQTLIEFRSLPCWLLVADVIGSTDAALGLPPNEWGIDLGRWFLACKELLEKQAGAINKYLGDGFLAFWSEAAGTPEHVLRAAEQLMGLRQRARPAFRFVVHHGEVSHGGVASHGEESLSGPAVNFVFRMEKLAAGLQIPVLFSEAAVWKIGEQAAFSPIGKHPLTGFEGTHNFWTL